MDEYSFDDIYFKLHEAKKTLDSCTNKDKRIALINYIRNISWVLKDISFILGDNAVFKNKNEYAKFIKEMDLYSDDLVIDYINNKNKHKLLMGKIISNISDIINSFPHVDYLEEKELEEAEFYSIMYEFMESIGLGMWFDDLFYSNNIYNKKMSENDLVEGLTIFNPVNKDNIIIIGDFYFDLHCMLVLSHELGHVYDLGVEFDDMSKFNAYYYKSFYIEVMSKLFEKLFLRFLFNKDILSDEALQEAINLKKNNYDFLVASYLISLLDGNNIKNDNLTIDNTILNNILYDTNNLERKVKKIIDDNIELNLLEDYCYAYGDIISECILDEVISDGIHCKTINKLLKERSKLLSVEFLESLGITADKYINSYNKSMQYLKK